MLSGPSGGGKTNTLMMEYSMRLGEAVLRSRTRAAEQTARIEGEIANKVKSEFISNMSHELRTPLNTVIGFSKLLAESEKRSLKQQEVAEYARLIQDAAGHLLALINDILDISKLQSGRYYIDEQEVELDDVLESCVKSFTKAAAAAGITLTQKIPEALPPMRGDPAKLHQALSSLISNAVKFTRNGGGILIAARARDHDGTEILIRDTGVGMEEDELKIAMTPFGQVDGGRSRWREGAGLGLPIASALINLHGGSIDIKSAKGIGTEIKIFLPSIRLVSNIKRQDLAMPRT